MILDIKRAFLYGDIEENIYIRLPEEDANFGKGFYGKLKKAMYGTRGAPLAWHKVVRIMLRLGFRESKVMPCLFIHESKDMKVCTHVDDFLSSGSLDDLHWLKDEFLTEFDLKFSILGISPGCDREGEFLGRTIKIENEGISYESGVRHIEI